LKKDPNGPYFPYPHKWVTTHTIPAYVKQYDPICVVNSEFLEENVSVAGRISSIRELSSKLIFYDLVAENFKVQIFFNAGLYNDDEQFETLVQLIKRGDIVGISGKPGRTKTGELSISPTKMRLLSPCLHMLPTERQGVKDPEIRYRQRYLDMICNKTTRDKFVTRSRIIKYIRNFLDSRGFFEVETPTLNIVHGGATAKPFVTYHNSLKRDLFMRVAPELFLKQLIIGGLDRVYEIGKNFRNEGIDQTHNPEFTACEFYWAYADYEDLLDFTEEMITNMVIEINGSEIVTIQDENGEDLHINFARPWRRVPMLEELSKHLGEDIRTDNLDTLEAQAFFDAHAKKHKVDCANPRTTARLIDKLVGHFLEGTFTNPTFLTEHPQLMCPLAKYHRTKPGLTERFELFINKYEYANAYTELNDPFVQRSLLELQLDVRNLQYNLFIIFLGQGSR
jgi:lysyl-tRNA synthetase, class II